MLTYISQFVMYLFKVIKKSLFEKPSQTNDKEFGWVKILFPPISIHLYC